IAPNNQEKPYEYHNKIPEDQNSEEQNGPTVAQSSKFVFGYFGKFLRVQTAPSSNVSCWPVGFVGMSKDSASCVLHDEVGFAWHRGNILEYKSFRVSMHIEDVKDKLFVAIIKALLLSGNRPLSPKELSSIIIRNNFVSLSSSAPYITVSSRILQHFKNVKDDRTALLGKFPPEMKSTRRLSYYVKQEGVPVDLKGRESQTRVNEAKEFTISNRRMSLRPKRSSEIIKRKLVTEDTDESDMDEMLEDESTSESDRTIIDDESSEVAIEYKKLKSGVTTLEFANNFEKSVGEAENENNESLPSLSTSLISDLTLFPENYDLTELWTNDLFETFSSDFSIQNVQEEKYTKEGKQEEQFSTRKRLNSEMSELLTNAEVAQLLSDQTIGDFEETVSKIESKDNLKYGRRHLRSNSLRGSTLRKACSESLGKRKQAQNKISKSDQLLTDINCDEVSAKARSPILVESPLPIYPSLYNSPVEILSQMSDMNDLETLVDFDGDDSDCKTPLMRSTSTDSFHSTHHENWFSSMSSSIPLGKVSEPKKDGTTCPVALDIDSLVFIPPSTQSAQKIWITCIENIPMFIYRIPLDLSVNTSSFTFTKDNSHFILRRADETGAVNASLLLHAGGITTESERTVILSLERHRVRLSKDRNSPLCGPWIPLNRARELARSCCLSDRLTNFLDDDLISMWSPNDILKAIQISSPFSSNSILHPSTPPSDNSKDTHAKINDQENFGTMPGIIIPADTDEQQVPSESTLLSSKFTEATVSAASPFGPYVWPPIEEKKVFTAARSAYRSNSCFGSIKRGLRQTRRTVSFPSTISPVKISKDAKDVVAVVAAKEAFREAKLAREKLKLAKLKEVEVAGTDNSDTESEDNSETSDESETENEKKILEEVPKLKINFKRIRRKINRPTILSTPKRQSIIRQKTSPEEKKQLQPTNATQAAPTETPKLIKSQSVGVDPEALKKLLDDAREKVASRKRLLKPVTPTSPPATSNAQSNSYFNNISPTTPSPAPLKVAPMALPAPLPMPQPFLPFPFAFPGFPPFPPGFPFGMLPPMPLGVPFNPFAMFGEPILEEKIEKKRKVVEEEDTEIIDVVGVDDEEKNAAEVNIKTRVEKNVKRRKNTP
ncbi:hypothetical protein HK096_003010, partial [Nowakowskiella sp. JEL0078]